MRGESQEYVVDRRLVKLDGRDREPAGIERADRLCRGGRIVDGQADLAVGGVHTRLLARSEAREHGQGLARIGGIREPDAEDRRADRRLQLGSGSLSGDPPPVDDRDLLRQAVRLLEILSRQQDRGAIVAQLVDDPPQLLARARIEPGRRLVRLT